MLCKYNEWQLTHLNCTYMHIYMYMYMQVCSIEIG